ncbi:hypothetical protein [Streptomyces klenkii]|uniref:hypothetical protein n=1 Tax=Streptomyces klenkii TaxID=1420899 RepID=UPI00341BB3E7
MVHPSLCAGRPSAGTLIDSDLPSADIRIGTPPRRDPVPQVFHILFVPGSRARNGCQAEPYERVREARMTDPDSVWQLMSGSTLVGTITVEDADMPWLRGCFLPSAVFNRFKPWFDEVNAIIEAEEFERFDDVYDRIESALTLVSPTGPVTEFLLHIDQDRAWFRWDGTATG